MDRIFVVESWLIVGVCKLPFVPKMLLPAKIFPLIQSETFVSETTPPDVYPAGIVYVPAFVPIVPPVLPLLAIDPLTEPEAPKAVLPVSTSPCEMSAEEVS